MTTSEAGIHALIGEEGIRLQVYRDPGAGAATIGIGHRLTRSERVSGTLHALDCDWQDGLTRAQAHTLFSHDIAIAEQAVTDSVRVPLAPHQFDALVSFVFNIGVAAFTQPARRPDPGCTLLRRLNEGNYAMVPDELRRWIYDDGVVVPMLRRRRDREAALWLGAAA
jgi:lysozyme